LKSKNIGAKAKQQNSPTSVIERTSRIFSLSREMMLPSLLADDTKMISMLHACCNSRQSSMITVGDIYQLQAELNP
jgi:hypothetical protein